MPRSIFAFTFLLFFSASVNAQYINHKLHMTEDVNKFLLANDTLWCITHPQDSIYGCLPCLNIGGLWLNTTLSDIKGRYGEPDKFIPGEHGEEILLYILPTVEERELPYLAVIRKNNETLGIELTGITTSKKINFSGLELGDKEKKILNRLGEPSSISPEGEYMHWDYAPYPFYLLLEEKKLHSVTIKNEALLGE